MHYYFSSFAIISLRKQELVALPLLRSCCHVVVSLLCLFLAAPWVNLWLAIVPFPGPEVIMLFSCSTQLSTKFILLISVKMPTIVGIFTIFT